MTKRFLKHTLTLLNTDYVKLDSHWNYQNILSPYHRIYYIDQGEGILSDTTKTLRLQPGYLYMIPSYTLCNLKCESFLSQYFVQFFEESADGTSLFSFQRLITQSEAKQIDIANFQRLVAINPGRGINRSDNPQVYEKHIYYKQYQELNNQQKFSDFLETQGILLQLLSRFVTQDSISLANQISLKNQNIAQPKILPAKIVDAMHFILLNLHLPLTIAVLAERANLNSEYFSRLFLEHTGTRPLTFIHEKRIERAIHIMATSQVSLSEVALMSGFDGIAHFSRMFKKIKAVSPSTYRKQLNQFISS